jgi:hypothetical protein
MIIIPYIHTFKKVKGQGSQNQDILIHSITILCEGGENFWNETDETLDIIKDCLEPNDIHILPETALAAATTYYAEVDTEKTDIGSMYMYEEVEPDSDVLCWRQFIILTDSTGEPIMHIPDVFQAPIRTIIGRMITGGK